MAEVLGILSSVIAIVGFTKNIIDYLQDVDNCTQDQIDLINELSRLRTLLLILQRRLQDAVSGDPWFDGVRSLGGGNGPLVQLQSDLARLELKLRPVAGARRLIARLWWSFRKAEIGGIISRIERLKTDVGILLGGDHL